MGYSLLHMWYHYVTINHYASPTHRCLSFLYHDMPRLKAIFEFSDMLRVLEAAKFDYDHEDQEPNRQRFMKLKCNVITALCNLERDFPESELSIFIHEVLHLPDCIYYWNSVRNFWCFVTERFVGYCKGFIKNRCLYIENLVRSRYIMYTLLTYANTSVTFYIMW